MAPGLPAAGTAVFVRHAEVNITSPSLNENDHDDGKDPMVSAVS